MTLKGELERYEEWRSNFDLETDGPHTFRQLDKLRRIDGIVWGTISDGAEDEAEKMLQISGILSE